MTDGGMASARMASANRLLKGRQPVANLPKLERMAEIEQIRSQRLHGNLRFWLSLFWTAELRKPNLL